VVGAHVEQQVVELAPVPVHELADRGGVIVPRQEERELPDIDTGEVHAVVRALVRHADRLALAQLRHERLVHREQRRVEVRGRGDLGRGLVALRLRIEEEIEVLQRRSAGLERVGDARRHGAARVADVHVHDVERALPLGKRTVDVDGEHEVGQPLVGHHRARRERGERGQHAADGHLARGARVVVEVELPAEPDAVPLHAEHGAERADGIAQRVDQRIGTLAEPGDLERLQQQVDGAELVLGRSRGRVVPQAVVAAGVGGRRVLEAMRRAHEAAW
jgi:hypothetical protein